MLVKKRRKLCLVSLGSPPRSEYEEEDLYVEMEDDVKKVKKASRVTTILFSPQVDQL